KKSLSPGCKEMLLEKMKEIKTFNALRVSVKARDHGEGSASTQKEKRVRCYICKIHKHVFWKCPNKKRKAMSGKQKEIVKPEIKKVVEKVNVYKNHMCLTRPLFKKLKYKFKMIEKEEIKKKFIFSYGVGDVTVEAREGNFVIPYVHYTPEVTLNVLSFDLLEEQGKKYVEMLKWFYLVYLNYDMLEEIPPVIRVMEINLLSLHKIVDSLGGYLCVTLGDKWKAIANLQGLTDDDGEAMKVYYKKFIDMVGNARVKDPQGKEKDDAGIEEALEEDMNKKTQFGVRLKGNLEEGAEEGSMTDSNDFEGFPYSLKMYHGYKVPMMTSEYGVEFYTRSATYFDMHYLFGTRARADIENNIIKEYMSMVRYECDSELIK
nr:ARID DNA-binding domain-containing protein [Tanacetum cinerariifolium]